MSTQKEITVIPPTEKHDKHIRVEQKQLKVAAYCRVSTRFEQQENSYEAQVKYYTEKIATNPKWSFAGIFADQGKPATSAKERDNFNDMIADCYDGKIDMILTKSECVIITQTRKKPTNKGFSRGLNRSYLFKVA